MLVYRTLNWKISTVQTFSNQLHTHNKIAIWAKVGRGECYPTPVKQTYTTIFN